MADNIGIANTGGGGGAGGGATARGGGPQQKQKRLLLIGGAGLGALLLLSHKGGQASSTDPNAQLQAQSDQMAAMQAGLLNSFPPLTAGATPDPNALPDPNASGDPNAQGGGGSSSTTTITNVGEGAGSSGDIIGGAGAGAGSNIFTGPGAGAGISNAPSPKPGAPSPILTHPGGRPAPGAAAGPNGAVVAPYGPTKPVAPKGFQTIGTGKGGWIFKPVSSTQAPRGKPAPALKTGQQRETPAKTAGGVRRNSPATVPSMRDSNAGVMVMGREFPGAIAQRVGTPSIGPDGVMTRPVTIDYGGRTDRHLVHNNGQAWTDLAPGLNPPSRGVPNGQYRVLAR